MRLLLAVVLGVGLAIAQAPKLSTKQQAALLELQQQAKDKPTSAQAQRNLAEMYLLVRDPANAVVAFGAALAIEPKNTEFRDRRGDAYLWNGKFTEAIADYDAVIVAKPDIEPEHWRRGIAYYYAGKFKLGVAQFETHKTVNPQDVENAAWHYLCNSRVVGVDKAAAALIDVTRDRRIPMKEIQKLYAGKLKPKDVIDAAEQTKVDDEDGTSARFYAHLYVGLWYEAQGNAEKAKEHLTIAADKYVIADYMWNIAEMHSKQLKAKK